MRQIRYREKENESEERLVTRGSGQAASGFMVMRPDSDLSSTQLSKSREVNSFMLYTKGSS